MPQITHLLFDCDNTLVLSEEIAFDALTELTNEILAKYNVNHKYTANQLMTDFVGQNFRGVLKGMQERHGFTLTEVQTEEYVREEENRVISALRQRALPCVGANPVLEKLEKDKKYKLAIVSSSAMRRVIASIEKAEQVQYFPGGANVTVFSAANSLPKPTTKPDPAIYLWACEKLGVSPKAAVAVEDSKSGTLSAVRAGIYTIAYTGSYHDPSQADEMAKKLMDLGAVVHMRHWNEFEDCMKKIEAM